MDLGWLTLQWFVDNFFWVVLFLIISTIILFLFPVLLSYDLYKKEKDITNDE